MMELSLSMNGWLFRVESLLRGTSKMRLTLVPYWTSSIATKHLTDTEGLLLVYLLEQIEALPETQCHKKKSIMIENKYYALLLW